MRVDALEHVRDPVGVMNIVWRILKPGGVALVAMPSLDSFSARIMKDQWIELKKEHLFYFNSTNLQTLLYNCGFSGIRMFPHHKILDLEYLKAHFEKYPSASSALQGFMNRLHWAPEFLRHMSFKTSDSGMIALARKNISSPIVPKKLSVIVPVYNEKSTFSTLMNDLIHKTPLGLEMEILVVESNSSDGTREDVLKLRSQPNVRILLQDVPRGKGNAVREALKHASGDIILIQDADLEYDLADYDPLLKPILQHRSSFTLGLRHKGGAFKMRRFIDKPFLAWFINLGHKLLTFLFNKLYFQDIIDPWTMFKVFRRDCVEGIVLECDGFDFDIELVIKLVRRGFAPLEIPVNYVSRSFAQGKKVSLIRDPIRILGTMLRLRFRSRSL